MLISAEYEDSYVISFLKASLYPDIKFEIKIYNGKNYELYNEYSKISTLDIQIMICLK